MFASADCLKDCASLYDELCLLFRLLFSAFDFFDYAHWAVCPVVYDMSVASSSPVEGRGRDKMVSERHGCNSGPLWARNMH